MTGHANASLVSRLSVSFAAAALSILAIVCVGAYAVTSAVLDGRQRAETDRVARLAQHLLREVREPSDEATFVHKLEDLLVGHGEMYLRLVRADGTQVFESPGWARRNRTRELALDVRDEASSPVIGRVDIQVRLERAAPHRILDVLAAALAAAALLGASSLAWIGARLTRRGLAPVDDLARRLGTWTTAVERPDAGGAARFAELRPLVERFETMLGEVRFAHERLRGFNEDVAHELRTPLAALIGDSEVTLAHARDADALAETLARHLDELRRLADIVNDMLFLARADASGIALRASATSLAALARDVADYFDAALESRRLRAVVRGDAHATLDAALLRRAMSNLLSNALRYANAGTTIEVRIDADPDDARRACVSVSNVGPAIADAHLPRLFDRFYRADASRERSGRNHGLGLAIVAAIARMHDGRVHARSESGTTTIGFCVRGVPAQTSVGPEAVQPLAASSTP